jgi:hypothetical protein
VFAETRRENRWFVNSVFPYHLTRGGVSSGRVLLKWAMSALTGWLVLTFVLTLTGLGLFDVAGVF